MFLSTLKSNKKKNKFINIKDNIINSNNQKNFNLDSVTLANSNFIKYKNNISKYNLSTNNNSYKSVTDDYLKYSKFKYTIDNSCSFLTNFKPYTTLKKKNYKINLLKNSKIYNNDCKVIETKKFIYLKTNINKFNLIKSNVSKEKENKNENYNFTKNNTYCLKYYHNSSKKNNNDNNNNNINTSLNVVNSVFTETYTKESKIKFTTKIQHYLNNLDYKKFNNIKSSYNNKTNFVHINNNSNLHEISKINSNNNTCKYNRNNNTMDKNLKILKVFNTNILNDKILLNLIKCLNLINYTNQSNKESIKKNNENCSNYIKCLNLLNKEIYELYRLKNINFKNNEYYKNYKNFVVFNDKTNKFYSIFNNVIKLKNYYKIKEQEDFIDKNEYSFLKYLNKILENTDKIVLNKLKNKIKNNCNANKLKKNNVEFNNLSNYNTSNIKNLNYTNSVNNCLNLFKERTNNYKNLLKKNIYKDIKEIKNNINVINLTKRYTTNIKDVKITDKLLLDQNNLLLNYNKDTLFNYVFDLVDNCVGSNKSYIGIEKKDIFNIAKEIIEELCVEDINSNNEAIIQNNQHFLLNDKKYIKNIDYNKEEIHINKSSNKITKLSKDKSNNLKVKINCNKSQKDHIFIENKDLIKNNLKKCYNTSNLINKYKLNNSFESEKDNKKKDILKLSKTRFNVYSKQNSINIDLNLKSLNNTNYYNFNLNENLLLKRKCKSKSVELFLNRNNLLLLNNEGLASISKKKRYYRSIDYNYNKNLIYQKILEKLNIWHYSKKNNISSNNKLSFENKSNIYYSSMVFSNDENININNISKNTCIENYALNNYSFDNNINIFKKKFNSDKKRRTSINIFDNSILHKKNICNNKYTINNFNESKSNYSKKNHSKITNIISNKKNDKTKHIIKNIDNSIISANNLSKRVYKNKNKSKISNKISYNINAKEKYNIANNKILKPLLKYSVKNTITNKIYSNKHLVKKKSSCIINKNIKHNNNSLLSENSIISNSKNNRKISNKSNKNSSNIDTLKFQRVKLTDDVLNSLDKDKIFLNSLKKLKKKDVYKNNKNTTYSDSKSDNTSNIQIDKSYIASNEVLKKKRNALKFTDFDVFNFNDFIKETNNSKESELDSLNKVLTNNKEINNIVKTDRNEKNSKDINTEEINKSLISSSLDSSYISGKELITLNKNNKYLDEESKNNLFNSTKYNKNKDISKINVNKQSSIIFKINKEIEDTELNNYIKKIEHEEKNYIDTIDYIQDRKKESMINKFNSDLYNQLQEIQISRKSVINRDSIIARNIFISNV